MKINWFKIDKKSMTFIRAIFQTLEFGIREYYFDWFLIILKYGFENCKDCKNTYCLCNFCYECKNLICSCGNTKNIRDLMYDFILYNLSKNSFKKLKTIKTKNKNTKIYLNKLKKLYEN